VRKPLMILGTLPRVVGPGETVDLPVNVFAMEKKVKNVNVTVASTKGLINVVDGATKSTSFKEVGDNIVMFRMKVADAIGMEKIVIRAEGGGEKAVYTIEIDVRNPNPKMTNAFQAVIDPGQTWSSDYTPIGVAGTNAGVLEVSTIPPLNLGQRLDYLISYPHGCIEQTTSSVFPQLFLSDLLKLDNEKKNEVDRNIKAGIDRLRSFQTSSGGLSYWPGDHEASEWGSNYAGHFLLEAEAKGYTLPGGFIDNWKRYQRTQAINWSPRNDRTYYSNDDLIQAYRLYTLALAKAPELGAMNRLREVKSLSVSAQWRLAAAYQLAGQPEIAKQLVTGISTTIPEYRELAWSFGSSERDEAMILETVSLMDMRAKGAPIAKRISDDLNNSLGWMSTQTTAYCLIALCKFSSADKMAGGTTFDYTVNRQSGKVSAKEPVSQIDMQIRDTKTGKVTVKNTGKNTLFVRVVLEGIPAAGNETDASDNLGMDVQFTSIYGTQIDPSKIDQGTDFIATVTITNPGLRGDYHQMALTQIFPSGWEIRNVRMEEGANTVASSSFDYQDIRDDRVYTYFSLYPRRANTYRVQLNAAYSGHFYLPAFYCEAMYDHTINARRAGRWVDVVPAGSDLQ
jgi:alpha-2-macroglobulin